VSNRTKKKTVKKKKLRKDIPEPSKNGDDSHSTSTAQKKKSRFSKEQCEENGNRKSQGGCIEYVGRALQRLKDEYQEHMYFAPDEDNVIDLVLGVIAGNHFDSDPVWIHLISPPSGGKTELLRALHECDESYFLSDVSSKAFISGYKDDKHSRKKKSKEEDSEPTEEVEEDYSLLPKLDGKTVVMKDFSLIHSKPSEQRAELFGVLRDAYDGFSSRAIGNMHTKEFHSRFNLLTGMTPDIEKYWSLNTLGERFLMYRIQIKDRRAHALKSLDNSDSSKQFRETLQYKVKTFIDLVPKDVVPQLPSALKERTLDLADLLSTCRSFVARYRNDETIYPPDAELAPRVAKQLMRVGQSVALVRGRRTITGSEFKLMKRVALDSLPSNRLKMLQAAWEHRAKPEQVEVFEDTTGLSRTTARRVIEDYCELGVITRKRKVIERREKKIRVVVYQLTEEFRTHCKNVGGV